MPPQNDAGYPAWILRSPYVPPAVDHPDQHPVFPLGGQSVEGRGPSGITPPYIFGSWQEDPGRSTYMNGDPALSTSGDFGVYAGAHVGVSGRTPQTTNGLGSWPTSQPLKYPPLRRPDAPQSGGPPPPGPVRSVGSSSRQFQATSTLGPWPPTSQNSKNPDLPNNDASSGHGLPPAYAGAYDTLSRATNQRPSFGPTSIGHRIESGGPALTLTHGFHRSSENGHGGNSFGFHGGMQDLPRHGSHGPTQSTSFGNGHHSGQPPKFSHPFDPSHGTGLQEPPTAGDFFSSTTRAYPDDGFGRAPARAKDRVVDPFTEKIEPGTSTVNPLIGTNVDSDGSPHGRRLIEWNMLHPDSTCKVTSGRPGHLRRAALDEPATFPRLSRLNIILPHFPRDWTINVIAADQFTGVTCRDILEAIYLSMYAFASGEDYRTLGHERQKEIGEVYRLNRARIEKLGDGMRRLDCLGHEVMFGGIIGDEALVERAIGRRLPGTFVLKAARP